MTDTNSQFTTAEQQQYAAADADLAAARNQDQEDAAKQRFDEAMKHVRENSSGFGNWVADLPTNISIGVMDAAINTADAIKHFGGEVGKNFASLVAPPKTVGADGTASAAPAAPQPPPELTAHMDDMHGVYGVARQHVQNFRDEMAQTQAAQGGGGMSDQLTQGAAQFAIPFLGFTKLLGGVRAAHWMGTVAKTALAESGTVATAFDPHTGRASDLFALGRHTEGKMGALLQTLAPDGSAQNAFIDYMTDRSNESEAAGRFKNVIDNLALSGAVAGLIHTGAATLKGAPAVMQYAAENAFNGPVGLKAQEGKVVFHGTPHDFEAFDAAKIGTGEGNQTFGHGLYFADAKQTAQHYQKGLGQRIMNGMNPAFDYAQKAMAKVGGSKPRAIQDLIATVGNSKNANERDMARRSLDIIRSGIIDAGKGMLAHVDIPDEVIGKMLNHDLPMSEQQHILDKLPDHDYMQLQKVLDDHGQDMGLQDLSGNQFRQLVERGINEGYIDTPHITGHPAADASAYLKLHGVTGIKYADALSRPGPGMKGITKSVEQIGDKWAVVSHGHSSGPAHTYYPTEAAARAAYDAAPGPTHNYVLFDPTHAKIVHKE